MTLPPCVGAYLLIIAPENPAIPALRNETTVNSSTADRSWGWFFKSRPYFAKTNATIVIEIGVTHATCSFHSMPSECQPMVAGLDFKSSCGNPERSAVPAGATARYHG